MAADRSGGIARDFGHHRRAAPRDSRVRFSDSRPGNSGGVLPANPPGTGVGEGEGWHETECLTSVFSKGPQFVGVGEAPDTTPRRAVSSVSYSIHYP